MRYRIDGFRLQQQRRKIEQKAQGAQAMEFFNVLTGPQLLEKTEVLLPQYRERLYPPTVTLSMFIGQALNEDGSCQKAVNGWASRRAAEGLSAASVDTGAYCKARQRLPVEMVMELTRETGRLLSAHASRGWRWRGRTVKLVDGTTISMPDSAENQARFPQPNTQAEGVGFPLARVVGVICLSTGALMDAAMGPCQGKGSGELDLFRSLSAAFFAGEVMLADALYCSYFLIALMQAAGVDVVFEQNGARITDFRRGRRLGPRDHVVRWSKPEDKPRWMSQEQYDAFCDELVVREVAVQGRILVTTMLKRREVGKAALSHLYEQRWQVELDLRNIKTTLGMNLLSCNTPQMNEKELWVHLLAYNLIRLLMAQAASRCGVHPRQLSFKHTAQLWTEWTARSWRGDTHHHALLQHIARITVGERPGRVEPRARKRRPKPYPWLKIPRAQARQRIQMYGHL